MRLILASGNNHKRKELEGIFKNHSLFLPQDLGIQFYHEETGNTFWENALGKAKSLFQEVEKRNIEGYSVLAADSVSLWKPWEGLRESTRPDLESKNWDVNQLRRNSTGFYWIV